VIRLDAPSRPGEEPVPPDQDLEIVDFVGVVHHAAGQTKLSIADDVVLRFGEQLDIKSIGETGGDAKSEPAVTKCRVARYLAKYVTKSVTDLGLNFRRLSPEGIDRLEEKHPGFHAPSGFCEPAGRSVTCWE
jgi:hypothetical protein